MKVDSVNNDDPENSRHKILFENLTPLFPQERLQLEMGNGSKEDLTARVIDLVAPIGKGQRGLIVAPPKAGKTMLLQNVAHSISAKYPECTLIILLIDERPEEVTEMQRNVKGKSQFVGPELKGKTLGVIGLGAIGAMVANLALKFGMDVIGYDPFLSVKAALSLDHNVKIAETLDTVYAKSDYITIHVPQTNDTKGMINATSIKTMKDGVRIINIARGGLVNNADILAALESGKVKCLVTDFAAEELLNKPNQPSSITSISIPQDFASLAISNSLSVLKSK